MTQHKIDEIAVQETSAGRFSITLWYDGKWTEQYLMDETDAKYLFNRLGGQLQ